MNKHLTKLIMTVLVLSIIAIQVQLLGCSGNDDSNPAPPPSGEVVMPLDIGNSWMYTYTASGTVQGLETGTATATHQVAGVTATIVDWIFEYPNKTDTYYEYYRNASGGLYLCGWEGNEDLSEPLLYCKYPCSVGDSWVWSTENNEVTWVVISTSEAVTVPLGTYRCIHIRGTWDNETYSEDMWFKVGLGLVKRQYPGDDSLELIGMEI